MPPYECPYEGRQGFWIEGPESMVMILAKDPRIESLEPNPVVHPTIHHQTLNQAAPNNRWRGP